MQFERPGPAGGVPAAGKSNIDILLERERVRGASRMIAEGTDVEAVTDDKARVVIAQVEAFCAEHKVSRKDLGRAIGFSASVMSEVLARKYKGDWRPIVIQLDAWLEAEIKRRSAPATTRFVWTSVAREIQTVASLVSSLKTIGLVYGPDTSGIGKTMALQAVHAETPGSILVTVEKVEANTTGLLTAICRALRISDGHNNALLYDRIKKTLAGTPRLLIIDQIHNLRFAKGDKPLYVLADLHDATRAPQLWCGTSDMVSYLQRGQAKGDEPLAQIRRRITYVRDLMQRTYGKDRGGRDEPLYTIEEIRQVFASNKLKLTTDAVRFLWSLACLPDNGALGTCKNLVLIATILGEHMGRTSIDAPLLRASLNDSVQAPTFTRLCSEVETRMAKVG
jgi:hypothetical protein